MNGRRYSLGYLGCWRGTCMEALVWHFWLLNVIAVLLASGCYSLKNVTLVISPPEVQRGKNVSLYCHYDLEGQQLYAVKWYRGQYEFYRFNPSESPERKIFIFPGIKVDLSQSNGSQVVLGDVGFNLSGNLSCEVTTEGPGFVTAVAVKHMMVVDLPKNGPTILTNRARYDPGDALIANCSSAPSKPHADLRFHVNNVLVGEQRTKVLPGPDSLQWSFLQINITLLPSHFDGRHSILPLRCTAIISTLYYNSTELRLPYRKEPIPERVTSRSTAAFSQHSFMLPLAATLIYLANKAMVTVKQTQI